VEHLYWVDSLPYSQIFDQVGKALPGTKHSTLLRQSVGDKEKLFYNVDNQEFMKQKDMTINENVFNSLITGSSKVY
jgi:hypothetical protein